MTATLVLIGLLALLARGVPVGFAMLITGSVGLYALVGFDALQGGLDSSPLSVASAFEFLTIPLFLLMAEFVLRSGKVDDLFRTTAAWVGELRGGLGMATALAGAGFGAICGTSTASAATLSATSLPAMIRQGYHPSFAAGVVAISGTLAMLIPPSVAMIVYGLLANVDIGKLLIAGILPGLLVMGTIIATVYILATRHPEHAPSVGRVSWPRKLAMLRGVLPILILFGVVTSVIYLGIATPTEAAAVGASGAFLLMASCGKLTRANLVEALSRAAHGSAMIIVILIGATVFGYFFALTQVTQNLVGWVGSLEIAPWMILACVLFGYIVLGAFLDQIAILVLTVPVVVPLMTSLDFDLIRFGVLIIVTAELGMVTPPVGLNCFIVARYPQVPRSPATLFLAAGIFGPVRPARHPAKWRAAWQPGPCGDLRAGYGISTVSRRLQPRGGLGRRRPGPSGWTSGRASVPMAVRRQDIAPAARPKEERHGQSALRHAFRLPSRQRQDLPDPTRRHGDEL